MLSKIDEANAYRGYDVILEGGKVASHFSHHWPDQAFKVITKEPISLNEWHHIAVTYDGSRKASGVKIYVDGQPRAVDVTTNNSLSGTLHTDKPFHIGQRRSSAPFRRWDRRGAVICKGINSGRRDSTGKRSDTRKSKAHSRVRQFGSDGNRSVVLRQYYLDRVERRISGDLKKEQANFSKLIGDVEKEIPETMVMRESEPRRPTHVLRRGQYDQRGDEVSPGVPAVFGSLGRRSPHGSTWFSTLDY